MATKQKTLSNYQCFLKTDTSAYAGEWVAIAKGKIVTHGKDAQAVYSRARKKRRAGGISLAKVPDEQVLVLKFAR